MKSVLIAGGCFHVAFGLFHLAFWRLFRWDEQLARLTSLNRAVVQVLNLCLTVVFAILAWVSFAHTADLLGTPLGRTLLLGIAVFWYLRAAQQVVFFGLRRGLSVAFLLLFLVGGTLYLVPWIAS